MAYPSFGSLALRRGFGGARGSYGAPLGMGHSVQQRSGGTLPEYLPGHPGYQAPTGPLTRTLPERVGQTPTGPLVTPLGQMSVSSGAVSDYPSYGAGGMLYGGRPVVSPGSGNVYYRDNTYNPSPQQRAQDDAGVARIRMYDAAAGSGPYDSPSALGRFQSLQGPDNRPLNQPPVGSQFGSSRVVDIDGRKVLLGPNVTPEAYAQSRQAEAVRHGNMYVGQAQPPAYGYSPEQLNRQAASRDRAAQREQMIGANRNIRANRQYGAPLLPQQFPLAQQAYGQQSGGVLGASPSRGVADLVARNTTAAEGESPQTNWGNVTRSIYDDPKFKSNPKAAWEEIRKGGMTSADVVALIDDAEGFFGLGADADPAYIAWLQGIGAAAGIQGPVSATPPPVTAGPLGLQPEPPALGNLWNVFGQQYGPSSPPATPPRRRPGPLYRPNF